MKRAAAPTAAPTPTARAPLEAEMALAPPLELLLEELFEDEELLELLL